MIKFVAVIFMALVFAALSYADVDEELQAIEVKFRKHMDTCSNNTGLTQDQLSDVSYFKIPKERAPMCFLACLANAFNLMDSNSKFRKAGIDKLLKPLITKLKTADKVDQDKGYKVMNALHKCVDEQTDEKDECVSATNAMECVVANFKLSGILEF